MSFLKTMAKHIKSWYDYIVKDDSWGSYFLSTILSLLFIVYIFYPGIGLLLSTDFPIVAIQSGSMEHDGNFNSWWNSPAICQNKLCRQSQYYNLININESKFSGFDFKNGFDTGDVMLVKGSKEYEIGQIIVFQTKDPTPIIHRIVEKRVENNKTFYTTKGDHNRGSIFGSTPYGTFIDEINIEQKNIYGRAIFVIPWLGWIKIWFFKIITNIWYLLTILILVGSYYLIKEKFEKLK